MTRSTIKDLVDRLAVAIESRREPDVYGYPNVYFLGEDVVAKGWYPTETSAKKEFDIGRFLFERGFSVPEVYDMAELRRAGCADRDDLTDWYIFMERIKNGSYRLDLKDPKERQEANEQFEKEVRKVRSLGFNPRDSSNKCNSLFERKKRQLYLIDFEKWYVIEGARGEILELVGEQK